MYRLHHCLCSTATPLDWLLSRNLKPRKIILRASSDLPRKSIPTKITRHTVCLQLIHRRGSRNNIVRVHSIIPGLCTYVHHLLVRQQSVKYYSSNSCLDKACYIQWISERERLRIAAWKVICRGMSSGGLRGLEHRLSLVHEGCCKNILCTLKALCPYIRRNCFLMSSLV